MALLTIASSDRLRNLPLKYAALDCAYLVIRVPRVGILPRRDTATVPLNFKLRLAPTYFNLFVPRDQQTQKWVMVLPGVTGLVYFLCFTQ